MSIFLYVAVILNSWFKLCGMTYELFLVHGMEWADLIVAIVRKPFDLLFFYYSMMRGDSILKRTPNTQPSFKVRLRKKCRKELLVKMEEDPDAYLPSKSQSKLDRYLMIVRQLHTSRLDILVSWNNNATKYPSLDS